MPYFSHWRMLLQTQFSATASRPRLASPGKKHRSFRPGFEVLETRETPATFGWALSIGSTSDDGGQAVATDSQGNVLVTGSFSGTVDFGGGQTLTSMGGANAFFAKYSPAGTLLWVDGFLSQGGSAGLGIAVDSLDRVYVAGFFNGANNSFITTTASGGPMPNAGGDDGFVMRVSPSGGYSYFYELGGTSIDRAYGIAVDSASNAYITGTFQNIANFGFQGPTTNLASAGGEDAFVAKLDATGSLAWADRTGSTGTDRGNGIAVDGAGNPAVTGYFQGTVDFDPGAGTANLDASTSTIFVSKLDTAGNFVWARNFGNNNGANGNAIAVDGSGNVYSTGTFIAPADFDPGPGTFNLAGNGSTDLYVSKLDSAGNFVWARKLGGNFFDVGRGIAVDGAGDVFTTGLFSGPADFDPGPGTSNLTGSQDIFVSKLDTAGNFVWAANFAGSANPDSGYGIAVDGSGHVYTTGQIDGQAPVDFDPGPGTYNLTAPGGAGATNIFVSQLLDSVVTITQSGGATTLAEGGATDTFSAVLTSAPTADVTITLSPDSQLTAAPVTLTFTTGNWNVPQAVTVTAVDDLVAEGTHSGIISFTTASADANFNNLTMSLTATITDNDTAGVTIAQTGGSTNVAESGATDTYTVRLNSQPTGPVTINLNSGTQVTVAPTSLVFTTLNWNTLQTVIVTAVDDAVAEGNHTGTIAHTAVSSDTFYSGIAIAGVTANITDNDFAQGVTVVEGGGSTDVSESGATDNYKLFLNSIPGADVIITLHPPAQLLISPSTLTFTAANWNLAQTVTVIAVDDSIVQGNRTAVITHTAASADTLYNGITVASVTANITDDDVADITFTPTTIDLAEGGPSNSYTVRLNSQPTANVILSLGPDSQVTGSPATLIFTPGNWNTAQTVNVTAVNDLRAEGTHNGFITHSAASADPNYNGPAATVTAIITDNDNPSVLISNGPITLLEGGSKTYTAILNSAPSADVVLAITPDAQLTVSPTTVTFTPNDWNIPRPVIVTAVDDSDEEGDHLGMITQTTLSADPVFSGLQVAGVTANIVDNDGSFVSGTDGNDQILVNFTADLTSVTVNGKLTSLSGLTQLLLFAGGGNDNIQVNNPTIPVVVQGGAGLDKVFVSGQTGANQFVLSDSSVSVNGQSVGVWNVESLSVGGKTGSDTFTIQDVPAFAVELKGDAGTDQVIGAARPNTWQITASNAGTVDSSIKISGMENWTGGSATDAFVFMAGKSITGRIDGGGGQDALDYSAYTSAVTVNLQTDQASGVKAFQNIDRIVGGKGSADKIIAPDQSNVWSITGLNAGNVDGVIFQNLENLTGGAMDDTFDFADGQSVKGKIDGGGGSDALDFSGYLSRGVTINLQAKTATSTGGFLNIEEFQGGSGIGDVLIAANKVNVWDLTGSGTGDVNGTDFGNFENLTGGTMADTFALAAGGNWQGTLNGGTGQDVLDAAPGQNIWITIGTGAGTLNGKRFLGVEIRR